MKNVLIFFMCLWLLNNPYGQDSVNVNHDNLTLNSVIHTSEKTSRYPYKTSFKKDAPIIVVGLGLTY